MAIQVYNSLSRKKEDFVPLNGHDVKMYTCGVTVYDRSHIGHARSLYVFDTIRRYLTFRDYKVQFVRNITDVDDKIIDRARETGQDALDVSRQQIAFYQEDLHALAIPPADCEPKATDNIADMVTHIQGLMDKNFAYRTEQGDVYFDVRAFRDYGKLSGQSIDKMHEAVRIEKDVKKKDPLDFALWKSSKPGEPSWESPWGPGRPGWHIECSCMSMKHLHTQTLDIHAGGRDLIFPHHENEIAQSEALTGVPFAKYWIHHGLLTVNGQKMSKSTGNFITIPQALEKYTVDEIKMLFLSSHYASAIDFSDDKMLEARKALQKFDVLFYRAGAIVKDNPDSVHAPFVSKYKHEFIEAMDDDFNTPKALAALFNLINDTNMYIDQNSDDANYAGRVYHAVDVLENLARNIFGLFLRERDRELTPELKALLEERARAREVRNFKLSDELRLRLKDKGLAVEDGKNGQTWRWL